MSQVLFFLVICDNVGSPFEVLSTLRYGGMIKRRERNENNQLQSCIDGIIGCHRHIISRVLCNTKSSFPPRAAVFQIHSLRVKSLKFEVCARLRRMHETLTRRGGGASYCPFLKKKSAAYQISLSFRSKSLPNQGC